VRQWGRIATLPLQDFRNRPGITDPGEFRIAHDISTGTDGTIYIADRENGRLQSFDQEGNYLGQRKFCGALFSVAVGPAGELYVGTQPRDVPLGTDSFIFKFDPKSGKILGKIPAAAHQLSVAPDGTLLPGTRVERTDSVLLFRPIKQDAKEPLTMDQIGRTQTLA
jgi:hypothetical protein